MKKIFVWVLCLTFSSGVVYAENNQSVQKEKTEKKKKSEDSNQSVKKEKVEKHIQEQLKREQKYAKEQTFYQGSDFNLSAFEIDKDSLSSVPELEPDYDFDMSSGVYTD